VSNKKKDEGLKDYRALVNIDSRRCGLIEPGGIFQLTPEEAQPLLDMGGVIAEVIYGSDDGST